MSDMGGEGTEEGNLLEVLRKPRDWTQAGAQFESHRREV